MRIDPLCLRARASCDAQLPLPGLPALKWCSFRFRLHRAGVGHGDHRHAEDVLGSCWQWQARDSQLLFRLRLSSVHAWRDRSRSYVYPFSYAGQSVGVSADAGYLDIECTTMGLPESGNSSLSSVALVRSSPIARLSVSEEFIPVLPTAAVDRLLPHSTPVISPHFSPKLSSDNRPPSAMNSSPSTHQRKA
jgi:hypothetical protein